MTLLDLDPDQLLSTTRAVRKRLDLTRDVPDELIRDCVRLALQAPSGSNEVTMRFVVVRDEGKRRAVAELYAESYAAYRKARDSAAAAISDPDRRSQQTRVADSADYLADHMGQAPVLVIGCSVGRHRRAAESRLGSLLPGMWSFMLAARARSLGTAWTTLHLAKEREVAEVLGIPYDTVAQGVLTPVAYTLGTDFQPARRPDPDAVIHWDGWQDPGPSSVQ